MSMFYYFACAEISFTEGYRVDKREEIVRIRKTSIALFELYVLREEFGEIEI